MPHKGNSSFFHSNAHFNFKKNSSTHVQMISRAREQQVSQAEFANSAHHLKMNFGQQKSQLSSHNLLIALFLLYLFVGAEAVKLRENIKPVKNDGNRKEPKKQDSIDQSFVLKQKIYHDVCTDKSFKTYNKPNITLGIQDKEKGKEVVPKSCVQGDKLSCQSQSAVLRQFKPHFQDLWDARNTRQQIRAQQKNWDDSVSAGFNATQLNSEQNATYHVIMDTVSQINQFALTSFHAERTGGGNCWESSARSLMKLINQKLENHLEMKIQLVTVFVSQPSKTMYDFIVNLFSDESAKVIHDHNYLLLDSNIHDVEIEFDAQKTAETLQSITEGKICDPWNYGYYADFKTDDSGLYNSEAGWDSLSIKTVSLNFRNFYQLPEAAQHDVRQKLSSIGSGINIELYPEEKTEGNCINRP